MKTSDLENDIRRLLAATKGRKELDDIQRQISCRVSLVCHHQIGVLAEKVGMTRTGLAERLLQQATVIAWNAAGLQELSEQEIDALKVPTKSSDYDTEYKGKDSMVHESAKFSRINCIRAVFQHLGLETGAAKDTAAIATSLDGSTRICCLTSKDYELEKALTESERYWFTIYENQLENIKRGKQSYVAFGCGSTDQIVLVPSDEFTKWSKYLPPYTQGKTGWHIHLLKTSGKMELRREGRNEQLIDVTRFVV